MSNAFCDLEIIFNTTDPKYEEKSRQYQGCPTIAITKKGRIFAAWCSGGKCEPSVENYNVVVYSDDFGKSWSEPVIVFPSSKKTLTQVLDLQLWVSPEGRLFIFIARDDVAINTGNVSGHIQTPDYVFIRENIANWMVVCDNPDDVQLKFNAPECWGTGIMRTDPLVLSNGDWLIFNNEPFRDYYTYSISSDKGKTFTHFKGANKQKVEWAEPMAYEKKNGEVCMFARCQLGKIAKATSFDLGKTWGESGLTEIVAPDSRMFVARTPSGKLLLVHNDHQCMRTNITVSLSEDDGATWKWRKLVDSRKDVSYPDVSFYDGKIYLIYDRERNGVGAAKEILMTVFTEEDLMKENYEFETIIVSKPQEEVAE